MIDELTFVNWGPFRGRHTIRLGPGAHALVAQHAEDPKRSNGTGKSMVLEAIQYALTGELNKSREFDVDGWITRGEKEGSVCLALEGGATILRSKKIGQSRQVRFSRPGYSDAAQAAADEALAKWLAFESDDFKRVAYFEQKEAARLINPERTDPATRIAVVSGWLGLGLADRGETRAGEMMTERWREVERATTRKQTLGSREKFTLTDEEFTKTTREAEALRGMVKRLEERIDASRAVARAMSEVAQYDAIVSEGKAVRAWIDTHAEDIERAEKEASTKSFEAVTARSNAFERFGLKKKIALGLFDGRCPVAEIECPAKDAINKDRGAAKKERDAAEITYEALERASTEASNAHTKTKRALDELTEKRARLKSLRIDIKDRMEGNEAARKIIRDSRAEDDAALAFSLHETRECLVEAESVIRSHERAKESEVRESVELDNATKELEIATTAHKTAHLAREVFRLARRRVAERALGEVEEDANEALTSVGVDLTISVRWEREAKKLATECIECGAPFPESRKVKECAACMSPRGMHSVPRLDFVRSDASGGYDDLTLQLSAGAWLLRSRQSPWSTAILDEPTAAMDPSVRRGLVRYLAGVASRGRYRQLLLVSHSSDFVDAIPNRITIVREASGARRIVS
jgi:DNA repair exonuclease SbcCD ATPase subunit